MEKIFNIDIDKYFKEYIYSQFTWNEFVVNVIRGDNLAVGNHNKYFLEINGQLYDICQYKDGHFLPVLMYLQSINDYQRLDFTKYNDINMKVLTDIVMVQNKKICELQSDLKQTQQKLKTIEDDKDIVI